MLRVTSYMKDCIFCKIANKDIPTEFLYEDDLVAAFRDIHPIAPAHILVIPKKHVGSVADVTEAEEQLMGRLVLTAKKIAEDLEISRDGYKLLFRVGKHGGQEVEHIHLHLIGGAKLREIIEPV